MTSPAGSAPSNRAGSGASNADPATPQWRTAIPVPDFVQRWRARWDRSLLLRVVATTVVLSLLVVGLIGVLLIGRVRAGLLDSKVRASVAEADAGIAQVQATANALDTNSGASASSVEGQIFNQVAARAGTPPLYSAVLLAPPNSSLPQSATVDASGVLVSSTSIPEDLRATVTGGSQLAWTFTTIVYADGRTEPGIAVGGPLTIPGVGTYELYYLFPTADEAATLQLVQRSLAVAGIVLVALLGLIAWFVTRQVVRPVSMAARIAEQFAAGRLEERMQVRGVDEIATLATAFNSMATSLKRQIRQLEDLSRVQRRFVSDVSHELRTPLTTIRMAGDVIYDAKSDMGPSASRAAELLAEQLDRFESLLTELLEISRFDAGSAILDAEVVDLKELVNRVVRNEESLAQSKATRVDIVEPSDPCLVEVDPLRVERILRNLVVNAIEHGESRPIQILLAADDAAVAVAVRDQGVGLRPGESSLVFNRFWRSDPSRARTTGGTGLGLSIALEDARLHGGWLEAWGEPGIGSVFRLTLPRQVGAVLAGSPLTLEPAEVTAQRDAALDVGQSYRTTPRGATEQESGRVR